jgi:hypothetical protein
MPRDETGKRNQGQALPESYLSASNPALPAEQREVEDPDVSNGADHRKEKQQMSILAPNALSLWMQTWLPIILSGLVLIAIMVQAYIYKKQWDAMQEGLKETRVSRELENAAFVGTKGASFPDGGLHIGQWQRIHVTLINTGKTPAFNLRVTQGWGIGPLGPSDFVPPNAGLAPKGQSTVMPNYDALVAFTIPDVTQEDLNAINNFQRFIYVWGTIDYDDIFGKPHWTRFCLMHHPTTNVFDSCGHWNECDYQYQSSQKPK